MNAVRWALSAALCAATLVACSSKSKNGARDAGAGGSNGAGGTPAGDAAPAEGAAGSGNVTCGAKQCILPQGAGIEQIRSCCTDDGKCGLKHPDAKKCLPADLPGGQTTSCPSFDGGLQLEGCCGPRGCGALDPFVGCMPNAEVNRPAVACNYDPKYDCSAVTGVECDGKEDCPTGQRCCGKFNGGYTELGCHPSCQALPTSGNATWVEICHAGDVCEDTTMKCLGSSILPPPLARCASSGRLAAPDAGAAAGEINCGDIVCGAGQKCCLRPPHGAYCGPPSTDCACHPAGVSDAGPG